MAVWMRASRLQALACALAACLGVAATPPAFAQQAPDNAYWRAREIEACGLLPKPAAFDLEGLARSAEAASRPVPQDVAALGVRADAGFEGMLNIGATTLRDVAGALLAGMSLEKARQSFAAPVRIAMATAETGAFLREPPPPPRSDAPLELIRHAYFVNLGQQFALNVLALRTLRALLVDGQSVLQDPGADRLARNGWIATRMLYANTRADRLRDNLASGVYRAGFEETEALICLLHGMDMYLGGSVAVLNGREDTAGQRGRGLAAVAAWRRLFARPEVTAAALRFQAKPALDAYAAKATALADHLEVASAPARFAKSTRDAENAVMLLDDALAARAAFVRQVLAHRLN